MRSRRRTQLQYLSLVLPGMVIFTVGLILPMFLAMYYSLTSWNGMTVEKPFVGLSNYVRMFADSYAGNAWLFTLKFTFWNTIIENVAAILLAVALDSGIKGQKLLRTVFFVPCLISAVVVGFVWLKIYGNVLPALFKSLGIDANPMLFGKESTVLGGFLIANNWQWIGYWMLIYLAALQSIPGDLYEAAKVDGASAFQRFRYVTMPLLIPAITSAVIVNLIGSLKLNDVIVSLTNGGPGHGTHSLSTFITLNYFRLEKAGYASAIGVFMFAFIMLVSTVTNRYFRKKEVEY